MVAPHGLPILCVSRGMIHPFCVYEKEWSRRQLHQPLLPERLEFVQHVRGHRAQNVRRKARIKLRKRARVLGLVMAGFAIALPPAMEEQGSQEPYVMSRLARTAPIALRTHRFVSSYCWVTRWTSM